MRAPASLALTLCLTVFLGACARQAASQAAAATSAASSAAPVQWDYASNDPAKNPTVANKESVTLGYNP
jgi:hypothetical protein